MSLMKYPSPLFQIAGSGQILPVFGAAEIYQMGTPNFTLAGCALSARTPARTPDKYFMQPRVGYLSSVSTSAAFMTMVGNVNHLFPSGSNTGNGQNVADGGFRTVIRFGVGDAAQSAGRRGFIGLSSATLTNADPSTFTNLIGVGHESGDTTWFIYYGGGTAQTRINTLVSNTTAQRVILELAIWTDIATSTPEGADTHPAMGVSLRVLGGAGFSTMLYGAVPVIPRSDVTLGFSAMRANVGGVTGTIGYDLFGYQWETWNN